MVREMTDTDNHMEQQPVGADSSPTAPSDAPAVRAPRVRDGCPLGCCSPRGEAYDRVLKRAQYEALASLFHATGELSPQRVI